MLVAGQTARSEPHSMAHRCTSNLCSIHRICHACKPALSCAANSFAAAKRCKHPPVPLFLQEPEFFTKTCEFNAMRCKVSQQRKYMERVRALLFWFGQPKPMPRCR